MIVLGAAGLAAVLMFGCETADSPFASQGGSDGDSDGDSDSDGDGDGDGDADGDSDGDTSTGPIEPDCSDCPGVGTDAEAMRCAIDLCDDAVLLEQGYSSPTGSPIDGTFAAVNQFGDVSNDLAPLYNGSYALMASGPATGTEHSEDVGGSSMDDPFATDGYQIYNAMEWRLRLRAPDGAHGFEVYYVFFSEEYDEWVSTSFNDKFYIFIEAASTNGGERTVINFTECRDPTAYSDFICDSSMDFCDEGQAYCYIAINTSLSECCWYDGCPDGTWTTNISGTGYSCAADQMSDSSTTGSSTGWLKTQWVIEPGEEFEIIFHIHDTSDGILDSEVILDQFLFLGSVDPGTVPVE
jgi:hypothetical protein